MKIFAIGKRVLTELFSDKRTLGLMFVAPLLVLTLMNVVFTTNTSTEVTIATVGVSSAVNEQLSDVKNVSVREYKTEQGAVKSLSERESDATVVYSDDVYDVTYANTDSGKTALTKTAFKGALAAAGVQEIKESVVTMQKKIAEMQRGFPNQSAIAQPTLFEEKSPRIDHHYAYGDRDSSFMDKMLPILMGFFVFFFVFLISGMALLKERTTGTLERLLATPVKRSEIVFGYMWSYGVLAVIQTLIVVLFTIHVLGVEVVGSIGLVILINVVLALVALAFGILMSTFAKSEFQMMQFIPVIVIPQVFFSGIIPLDAMAQWIKYLSCILPLSYVGEAMNDVVMYGEGIGSILPQLGILLLFLLVLSILNITGLKRYRKEQVHERKCV